MFFFIALGSPFTLSSKSAFFPRKKEEIIQQLGHTNLLCERIEMILSSRKTHSELNKKKQKKRFPIIALCVCQTSRLLKLCSFFYYFSSFVVFAMRTSNYRAQQTSLLKMKMNELCAKVVRFYFPLKIPTNCIISISLFHSTNIVIWYKLGNVDVIVLWQNK